MRSKQEVYSLHCLACDEGKEDIFAALCPKCQYAMLRAYPAEFFMEVLEPLPELDEDIKPGLEYLKAA